MLYFDLYFGTFPFRSLFRINFHNNYSPNASLVSFPSLLLLPLFFLSSFKNILFSFYFLDSDFLSYVFFFNLMQNS